MSGVWEQVCAYLCYSSLGRKHLRPLNPNGHFQTALPLSRLQRAVFRLAFLEESQQLSQGCVDSSSIAVTRPPHLFCFSNFCSNSMQHRIDTVYRPAPSNRTYPCERSHRNLTASAINMFAILVTRRFRRSQAYSRLIGFFRQPHLSTGLLFGKLNCTCRMSARPPLRKKGGTEMNVNQLSIIDERTDKLYKLPIQDGAMSRTIWSQRFSAFEMSRDSGYTVESAARVLTKIPIGWAS